jgi:hypothetical protein
MLFLFEDGGSMFLQTIQLHIPVNKNRLMLRQDFLAYVSCCTFEFECITELIMYYVLCSKCNCRPPVWSSGQSACRSRGLGLIPSSTRFSEKYWVWNRKSEMSVLICNCLFSNHISLTYWFQSWYRCLYSEAGKGEGSKGERRNKR